MNMNSHKDILKSDDSNKQEGASLVEYALLVALIAVVCIAAITFLGTAASGKLSYVGSAIGSGSN